jgi:hypothetical protein
MVFQKDHVVILPTVSREMRDWLDSYAIKLYGDAAGSHFSEAVQVVLDYGRMEIQRMTGDLAGGNQEAGPGVIGEDQVSVIQ